MSFNGLVARWNSITSRMSLNAAGDSGAAAEDLVLDLVNVVLEARHHRLVAVDDVVDDRVRNRRWTAPQQVGARLEPPTHRPAPARRRGEP